MKIYNPQTWSKLGFDEVLERLRDKVSNEESYARCADIGPIADTESLLAELDRVNECRDILEYGDPFPAYSIPSVSQLLRKASVSGNWLKPEEIHHFSNWLRILRDLRSYLHSRAEKYPALHGLINRKHFPEGLIGEIDTVLDESGLMRDHASPLLTKTRKELHRSSTDLRTLLNRILRKSVENKWSEEAEITLRNDRLVIPVKSDARGRIPGFIQDISQSGQTVFIEPADALPLNNRIRELQIAEQNEVIRILVELTKQIALFLPELTTYHELMIRMDLIRAKASIAVELKAVLPKIDPEGELWHIREGRYPVLVFREKESGNPVIPLELHLERERRILIISGPNAGGKSVALKTAGLLQLMLQSGFLIPVDERSRFRLFSGLFLDLGDEQSVASDLSTYTSHLFQMRLMGDHMDGNSLFLIDEFGSGTDPELGGAIAEAFLERFIRQEAFGLITTHYGNLKEVAGRNSEVVNAAMEFDTKGLRPTFRMVEGIPGRSYAFEIAARVGVHPTILRRARRKLGKERVHTEDLLKEMETKNRELESLLSQNRQKEAKLAAMVGNYEKLSSELESGKKEILRNAKAEARDLIKSANRDIERTIREIREQQAEKKFTKKIRKELSAKMPEPEEALPLPPPQLEDPEMEGGPVKVGDWVRIRDAEESIGKLVELKGKRAIVEMGDLRMHIKLDQLIRTRKPPKKKPVRKGSSGVSLSKMGDAMQDLNLMGMRVEEALPVVDKAIDNAMIVGLPSLRILHGKGTGTLREAIRRHLSGNPLIDSMEDAAVEQGGTGWTLVRFRA